MAEGDSVPRLVLISGATGAGKTTLAKAVAHEMGMARIASSDTIREVMRATADSPDPALNRSSYGRGEVGDPATDWEDAAKAVQPGIEAVVERARRQGVDLVIEGVHVIPSRKLIGAWEAAGGAAVGIVVKIEDEDTHRERIENARRILGAELSGTESDLIVFALFSVPSKNEERVLNGKLLIPDYIRMV